MIKLTKYVLKNIDINDIKDNDFFNKMNQDEEFKRFFGGVILNDVKKNSLFMNDYMLQMDGQNVGYIYIGDKITRDEITAVTLYYYIDKLYRGNGIATEALKELIEYLTEKENINYFILNIHKENMASIKVAINNGFIKKNDIEEDEEEIQFIHKTL